MVSIPRSPRYEPVSPTDSWGVHCGKINNAMLLDRITIDPAICHGKPTVRGLRYPVDTILDLLSSGMSHEEILSDYEDLEPDDLLAVLAFAAQLSRVKRVQAVR